MLHYHYRLFQQVPGPLVQPTFMNFTRHHMLRQDLISEKVSGQFVRISGQFHSIFVLTQAELQLIDIQCRVVFKFVTVC